MIPKKLHRISQAFREIQVKEGIYAVLGHHDPASDDPIFRQFLTDAKIHLLDNQTAHTQAICLVGRSDASHHQRSDVDLKHWILIIRLWFWIITQATFLRLSPTGLILSYAVIRIRANSFQSRS